MAKGKVLKEAEFKQIKALQDLGFKNRDTCKIVGRSSSLVGLAYKSTTLAEYKELSRTKSAQYRKGKTTKQAVPAEHFDFDEVNTIVSVLKAIEYQLEVLNSKVEGVIR